jgi:hypothetical protein
MAYSEAQKKATAKYMKANLDDIKLRVPKGKREEYKKQVSDLGYKSFNEFAIKAIEEKIEREKTDN